MQALDQFIAICSQAAQRSGLKAVVVAAQDPMTGEVRVVASPDHESLRTPVANKLGLVDPGTALDGSETGWPD